ncbi:MAG: SLBB domain-containing protein [Elusimicrobia bacterium]|nr:SLBB domain-containing protein [Elusimicrobiota bacterium]
MDFSEKLKSAGVIGAGGAGFPAYVKAQSKAEIIIMNAAECEPLLKKDQKILEHFAETSLDGLELMMKSTSAAQGAIGIKKKHAKIIKRLEDSVKTRKNLKIHLLGDYYPAGDEFCLVYEITGRLVPMGGIPIEVGVVVNNVETLYNAAKAERTPVVEKFFTVAGAVKKPATFRLPVGMTYLEAVNLAGGVRCADAVGIDGGPMMGNLLGSFEAPVTKISSGVIVLPRNHPLAIKKTAGESVFSRTGKSACDQCSYCTELCPRYLLGHKIQPHKVMRSLLFSGADRKPLNEHGLICCECSLCSLYSCPENLDPKNVCASAKKYLRERNIGVKNSAIDFKSEFKIHPLREDRKTPVSKLIERLGLKDFNVEAEFEDADYRPEKVRILLSQHTGVPCSPCVSTGQKVKKGDMVGEVPFGKLGCPVHASIDGIVSKINEKYVEINSKE